MLFNLEPDITVTGGAWYSDQDFESEFVEVLNQQCYKYLEQKVWNRNCNQQLVCLSTQRTCCMWQPCGRCSGIHVIMVSALWWDKTGSSSCPSLSGSCLFMLFPFRILIKCAMLFLSHRCSFSSHYSNALEISLPSLSIPLLTSALPCFPHPP